MLTQQAVSLLSELVEDLKKKFDYLPPDSHQTEDIIPLMQQLVSRLANNDPYFHPRYMAHMTSYVVDVASMAYFLTMQINPNNHSFDGGRATTLMELECIDQFRQLFGWQHIQGHLTASGTIANLEALWLLRAQGTTCVLCSDQAHFCHEKNCHILGLDLIKVKSDSHGKLCITALKEQLQQLPDPRVAIVIATAGTTLCGAVDPIDQLIQLKKQYGFFLHLDGAYGGYFYSIRSSLAPAEQAAFACLPQVDTLIIDPHKHGMQGFGCGAILINIDLFEAQQLAPLDVYQHQSPYTYFDQSGVNLGENTLECSRSGAAAAALWACMQAYPLQGSVFHGRLNSCLSAARHLARLIQADPHFCLLLQPALDIVLFYPLADDLEQIAEFTVKIKEALARRFFYVALAEVDCAQYRIKLTGSEPPRGKTKVLRLTLMKPEHAKEVTHFYRELTQVYAQYLQASAML